MERVPLRSSVLYTAFVHMAKVDVVLLCGLEEKRWHFGEELLGVRLGEHFQSTVPSAAFKVETVHVGTVLGRHVCVCLGGIGDNNELKLDLIDGQDVLSREVLLESSHE